MQRCGYASNARMASDYPLNWSYVRTQGPYTLNVGSDYIDMHGDPRFRIYAARYLEHERRPYAAKREIRTGIELGAFIREGEALFQEAVDQAEGWSESGAEDARS